MADIANDNPSIVSRKRLSLISILTLLLPPLLLLGSVFMAADFTAIGLRPLRVLHIPYPRAMDYAHFLIPGSCALIWLAGIWKWPSASSTISVLLCFVLIAQLPAYVERRTARIPVTRFLDWDETESFESRNGFAICQTGSREGLFVIVAPENAVRAREDLGRLGLGR